jgi:hypothetical protein
MSVTTSPVSTQDRWTRDAEIPEAMSSFEERWTAWQARGDAHDRVVRRQMTFGAPILAIVAALLYVLLLR